MRLPGNLLAPRQKCLDFSEVDRGGTAVKAGNRPGDHGPTQFLVLDVQRIPLGFTELLDHHLLGRLGRNTTKDRAQIIGRNLYPRTMHGWFARGPVDMDLDLRFFTVVPTCGREDRLFDSFKDDTLVDVLVAVDGVDQPEKFGSVHHCSFSACYPQSGYPALRKHPARSEIRNFRSQESPVVGCCLRGPKPQRRVYGCT